MKADAKKAYFRPNKLPFYMRRYVIYLSTPIFYLFGLVLILFGLPLVPLLLIVYIVMQPEVMNSFINWASYLLPF